MFLLFDLKLAIDFRKNSKVLLTKNCRYSIIIFRANADVISILSNTPNTQNVFSVKLSKLQLKYAR